MTRRCAPPIGLRRAALRLALAIGLALGGPIACGGGAAAPAASAAPEQPLPAMSGPKRVVAVQKFESIGSFTQKYGDWDVGGGLAAMLTTSLGQSGRFVVVERADLNQIVAEQQLKAGNAVNPETGPESGQLTGAQFLVIGAVTEFGTQDKGTGLSIGGGAGGGSVGMGGLSFGGGGGGGGTLGGASPFGGGGGSTASIGATRTEGSVAIDLRIVDTTTGQVVQTSKVRQSITSTDVNFSGNYKGMPLGGEQFWSTPLGEATRRTIDQAVAEVIRTASREPWQGLIVDFDGHDAVINAGGSMGVKPGDSFAVQRVVQRLTDPKTGELLSVRRRILGRMTVALVEDKVATGPYTGDGPEPPQRGDLVVLLPP